MASSTSCPVSPGPHQNHPVYPAGPSHFNIIWTPLTPQTLYLQDSHHLLFPQTTCPPVFQTTWQHYLPNHFTESLDITLTLSFLRTKSCDFYLLKYLVVVLYPPPLSMHQNKDIMDKCNGQGCQNLPGFIFALFSKSWAWWKRPFLSLLLLFAISLAELNCIEMPE